MEAGHALNACPGSALPGAGGAWQDQLSSIAAGPDKNRPAGVFAALTLYLTGIATGYGIWPKFYGWFEWDFIRAPLSGSRRVSASLSKSHTREANFRSRGSGYTESCQHLLLSVLQPPRNDKFNFSQGPNKEAKKD